MEKKQIQRAAWEHFSTTGKIGSYLLYRAVCFKEREEQNKR